MIIKTISLLIRTLLVAFTFAYLLACGGSSSSSVAPLPPPPPPVVDFTPRLAPGPHIDFLVGFDLLDTTQQTQADLLFLESVTMGRQTTRTQLDWGLLETQPGVFDISELMQQLDAASQMQQSVFVTLTTLDTGGLTLPVDLMSADQLTPAPGLSLDGAEIRQRLHAFLDWLVPELAGYNVWGLSIANEASTNIGNISEPQIIAFLTDAIDYTKSLDTELAVTLTVASSFDPSLVSYTQAVMANVDIAMYNYYCLDNNGLTATDQTRWISDLNTMIGFAGNRDIFFQELGCPTGYSDIGGSLPPPEVINSSVQTQSDFFQFMMDQLVADNQLRGATIFQLFDWSPVLATTFANSFLDPNDPGSTATAAALREWLTTVGMCRWSDGVCRQAWAIFLDGVSRAAAVRVNNA